MDSKQVTSEIAVPAIKNTFQIWADQVLVAEMQLMNLPVESLVPEASKAPETEEMTENCIRSEIPKIAITSNTGENTPITLENDHNYDHTSTDKKDSEMEISFTSPKTLEDQLSSPMNTTDNEYDRMWEIDPTTFRVTPRPLTGTPRPPFRTSQKEESAVELPSVSKDPLEIKDKVAQTFPEHSLQTVSDPSGENSRQIRLGSPQGNSSQTPILSEVLRSLQGNSSQFSDPPGTSGLILKNTHPLAVSPRPLTGTPRPPPGSSPFLLQCQDTVVTPYQVVAAGHSRYLCAGSPRLLFGPAPNANADGTPEDSGTVGQNSNSYHFAPMAIIQPSLVTEARQLYIKRTRTLFSWMYPKADRQTLPQMVEKMWEDLPATEKEIYFEQVLGKDSKDWQIKRQPSSNSKPESKSSGNLPQVISTPFSDGTQKICATSIVPPKLMINPHLRMGLPIPAHTPLMEKPKAQPKPRAAKGLMAKVRRSTAIAAAVPRRPRPKVAKPEGDQEVAKARPKKRKTCSHLCEAHAEERLRELENHNREKPVRVPKIKIPRESKRSRKYTQMSTFDRSDEIAKMIIRRPKATKSDIRFSSKPLDKFQKNLAEAAVENESDGIEASAVNGAEKPDLVKLVTQENAAENEKPGDAAWVGQNPGLKKIQQDIPRFHKDRELVSFIPTKSKEFVSNRESFMRSRRSYHTPGTLDLSRFYGENAMEDEDYRSEKERAAERARFMRFVSLLAMKEGGGGVLGNGNSNGLNYQENDFDDADEDNEPIELGVHYNPYSVSSSVRVRQRQRNRNGDRMFSNNLDNTDSNSGSDFLSPGEAISLESSHPKNIHPTNKQNQLQQKQRQHSPTSGPQFPRRLTMAAASLKNGEDNEGYWSEDAIPLQAHSLTRRSGGNPAMMLARSQGTHSAYTPGFRGDPFENPAQRNDAANNFFNEFYQLQTPFMRNSDLGMNSRLPKSGDDGLYSLNQLLSGAQEIDPRVPVYQRNVL